MKLPVSAIRVGGAKLTPQSGHEVEFDAVVRAWQIANDQRKAASRIEAEWAAEERRWLDKLKSISEVA